MMSYGATVLVLLFASAAVACSEVQVDPEGAGGRNASGGDGDGSGAGRQNTASSSSSSSTGEPLPLCQRFCEATGSCFDDCEAVCESYQEPPCEAIGVSFTECMIESYDSATCATDPQKGGCDIFPLLECRTGTKQDCEAEVCVGSEVACACTRECSGGEQKITCTILDDNAICTCYLNATPFVTWLGPDFPQDCSLAKGPCAYDFGEAQ